MDHGAGVGSWLWILVVLSLMVMRMALRLRYNDGVLGGHHLMLDFGMVFGEFQAYYKMTMWLFGLHPVCLLS
jgi:hypothetical protein